MYKPISYIHHSFLLLVLIGTYGSLVYFIRTAPSETHIPTRSATSTPAASLSTGIPEAIPDTGWSQIQPGLERRVIQIYNDQNQPVEALHLWRVDQKHFRMDVEFNAKPKSLETWQKETNASLVINGGYFSIANERYSPDGLIVLNGRASGQSTEAGEDSPRCRGFP